LILYSKIILSLNILIDDNFLKIDIIDVLNQPSKLT